MNKEVTKQIINLKFRDNEKEIKFDISKNIVFYGLNGHGKTRILKTIDLLIKLCKEKSIENSINIIKELNLEHLEIDGLDYNELFNLTQEIEIEQNSKLKKSFSRNKFIFDDYIIGLSHLQKNLTKISDIVPLRLVRQLKHLVVTMPKEPTLQEFEYYLTKTRHCLLEIARFTKLSKINSHNVLFDIDSIEDGFNTNPVEKEITNLLELNNYLNINIIKRMERFNLKNNQKYQETFISKKENIIRHLSVKNVIYISCEDPNLEHIVQLVNKEFLKAKESLFLSAYNGEGVNNYYKVTKNIELIAEKRNIINNILKKYADIKLYITENGEFLFEKSGFDIEYSKLSSGERRIIYLIMTIIFNNVDIYLVDEPEISLSLDYQNKIINDLHYLTKHKTLMIATHAPFIYDDFQSLPNSTNIEI